MKLVMTTKEVAGYLSVSEAEVRRLAAERIIPPLRGYRNPFRFSAVAIKKWLEGGK